MPMKMNSFDPFWFWNDTQSKLALLLRSINTEHDFPLHVEALARFIQGLSEKDSDSGIGAMLLLDSVEYPIAHMMHVAIVSELTAKRLGWSVKDRLDTICAAVTMNISMLDLQTQLLTQTTPLTETQHQELRSHPHRSLEMLQAAGVTHINWLSAVRDHHETRAGDGYPRGIKNSSEMTELLRIADIFCAKVTSRSYRQGVPANVAARDLFKANMEQSKNPIPLVLIKEIGIYPPGSFVMLVNGETAIVVRRGQSANTPSVSSLLSPEGIPYPRPIKRDTSQKAFTIKSTIPKENIPLTIDPAKLWVHN